METIVCLFSEDKVSVLSIKASLNEVRRHLSNLPRKTVSQTEIIEVE